MPLEFFFISFFFLKSILGSKILCFRSAVALAQRLSLTTFDILSFCADRKPVWLPAALLGTDWSNVTHHTTDNLDLHSSWQTDVQ